MTEKQIKSRTIHKHDIEANFQLAVNFTPKQGEIIVYDVDENYSYERFKIGDGVQNVNDLPFINSVADWNQNDETALDYVKNRTHYEETTQIPLDIKWDGVIGDRDTISLNGISVVKVSDLIISDEELKTCTVVASNGEMMPLADVAEEDWMHLGESTFVQAVAVARNTTENINPDPSGEPVYAPSTGIYLLTTEDGYLDRLYSETVTMTGTIVHKLPVKYLPDGMPYKEEPVETVILPETTLDSYMVFLDALLDFSAGEKYRVTYRGKDYECICKPIEFIYEGAKTFGYGVGNAAILDMENNPPLGLEDTGEPFIIGDMWNMEYPGITDTLGLYVSVNTAAVTIPYWADGDTISVTHIDQEIHKISQEYLEPRTHWVEEVDIPLDISIDYSNMFYMYGVHPNKLQYIVRISSKVLTKEELTKCYAKYEDGYVTEILESNIEEVSGGLIVSLVHPSNSSSRMEQVYIINDVAEFNENGFVNGVSAELRGKLGTYLYTDALGSYKKVVKLYSNEVMMSGGIKYHTLSEEYLPEKAIANANFEQTDPNGAGYIEGLDRTEVKGDILYEYTKGDQWGGMLYDIPFVFVEGDRYIVTIDGVEYESEVRSFSVGNESALYLGNFGSHLSLAPNTGEPFCFFLANEIMDTNFDDNSWQTISFRRVYIETKIAAKYLPDCVPSIPVPTTATVGQLLAVKAVDENGKPTEWGLVTISLTTDENGVMKITMT